MNLFRLDRVKILKSVLDVEGAAGEGAGEGALQQLMNLFRLDRVKIMKSVLGVEGGAGEGVGEGVGERAGGGNTNFIRAIATI